MRGKAGIVVGLAVGYVLGSRAGRERYDQIKAQWLKLWNLAPVQKQVDKAKEIAASTAMALPSTLWDSAVKVAKAASAKGTPGQKLDAAVDTAKDSADDVGEAAKKTAKAAKKAAKTVKDAAEDTIDDVVKAARDDDGD